MVRIYIVGIIALLFVSCSDFLKEYSQDLAYVNSYTDLDELLPGGAYLESDFSSFLYTGHTPYVHMMGDEMRENIEYAYGEEYNSSCRDDYFGYYTWQKRVDIGFDNLVKITNESSDWKRLYEHINVANMIIAEIADWSGKNDFEDREISRIRGEAYFLRGAYYFWLVNLYGRPYTVASAQTDPGVPLKLTEYIEDKKFTRNSVLEVYDQVLKDLDEAEKALEKTPRKSVFRADITAAYLLKSRVYLYMRDWKNAAYYANKVLEKNDQLLDLNVFDATSGIAFMSPKSVETIFSTGDNWVAGNTSMRQKGMSASEDLINLYKKNVNDLRLEVFLNTNYPPYFPCNKYAYDGGEMSDVCTYRTAEAYLNLAEALAYQGDDEGACEALNYLRKHRIRNAGEIHYSGKELVVEIRDERFRELAFEGHRWYDLSRYSVCDRFPLEKAVRNTYTTYYYDGSYWVPLATHVYELKPGDPAYVMPIPADVLTFEELMQDNARGERNVVEIINYN